MQRRNLLQALLAPATLSLPSLSRGAAAVVRDLQLLTEQAQASAAFAGLQIAVLAERRPLWSAALGLANASKGQAVGADTGFYIASTTKCFTALAAAQLAARGTLDLQRSLADLLPQVPWRAELRAEQISLRELLTHSHGIDGNSVAALLRVNFSGVYRDNAELLRWLAQATPNAKGKAFEYANIGYDLAAMAMAPSGRGGWKTLVQQEVLEPLDLRHTSPWRSALPSNALAAPHARTASGWQTLPANKQDSNMGPAGGMFSTADELARLIQVLLDGGRREGRTVLAPEALAWMLNPQIVQSRSVMGYQRQGHTLGFDLASLHGRQVLTRMGNFRGASSHLSFMPEQSLGMAVLSNGDALAAMAAEALAQAMYRCLLDGPVAAHQDLEAALKPMSQAKARLASTPAPAAPEQWPLHPEQLVGRYHDEQLGDLDLHWSGSALRARWGVLDEELTLRFPDKLQWRVDWSGAGILLEFLRQPQGSVSGLKMFGRELQRMATPSAGASTPAAAPANAGRLG